MSACYDICCTLCRKSVWVGQSANREVPLTFYSGEEDTMEDLRVFLWEHRGHPLLFDEDQNLEIHGHIEYEDDKA